LPQRFMTVLQAAGQYLPDLCDLGQQFAAAALWW
jgi:hypothetical protein